MANHDDWQLVASTPSGRYLFTSASNPSAEDAPGLILYEGQAHRVPLLHSALSMGRWDEPTVAVRRQARAAIDKVTIPPPLTI